MVNLLFFLSKELSTFPDGKSDSELKVLNTEIVGESILRLQSPNARLMTVPKQYVGIISPFSRLEIHNEAHKYMILIPTNFTETWKSFLLMIEINGFMEILRENVHFVVRTFNEGG